MLSREWFNLIETKKLIEDFLEENWEKIRKTYPNVINVGVGNKRINGAETDQPCIVFYVSQKKPLGVLKPEHQIPRVLDEVRTDVVELSAKDYVMGETEPSKLPHRVQKRLAGGVKR